jgi:hypothetical protein
MIMSVFPRRIGIDYSGAATPTASLKGLRVYLAEGNAPPAEFPPPPRPRRFMRYSAGSDSGRKCRSQSTARVSACRCTGVQPLPVMPVTDLANTETGPSTSRATCSATVQHRNSTIVLKERDRVLQGG